MASNLTTYKCWYDNQETWDPNNIDPPALIEAESVYEAACKFASGDPYCDDGTAEQVIVLDNFENYYIVAVRRSWNVVRSRSTSLAELCDEAGEEDGEAPL